jgi:hypothetical protein
VLGRRVRVVVDVDVRRGLAAAINLRNKFPKISLQDFDLVAANYHPGVGAAALGTV